MKISKKAIEDIVNRLYTIEQDGEKVIRPELLNELIAIISGRYDNAGYSVEKTVGGERLVVYSTNKNGVRKIFERKIGYDVKSSSSTPQSIVAKIKWPTKEIVTIIKNVQEEFGVELFQDRRRSVAILADVLAPYQEEAKIIKMIFNEGVFNVIGDVPLKSMEEKRGAYFRVEKFLMKLGISDDVRTLLAQIITDSFYITEKTKPFVIEKEEIGIVYFLATENTKERKVSLYKMITQSKKGLGKLERVGFDTYVEALNAITDAYQYLMLNGKQIDEQTEFKSRDYKITFQNCINEHLSSKISMGSLISMASSAMNREPLAKLAIAGNLSSDGEIVDADNLGDCFNVCAEFGIKTILLPIYAAKDFGSIPAELLGKCSVQFYTSPIDAVRRALGVL